MFWKNQYTFQKNADKIVDDKTAELGKTSIDKNIVVDSRLAWHFIPKSYK